MLVKLLLFLTEKSCYKSTIINFPQIQMIKTLNIFNIFLHINEAG